MGKELLKYKPPAPETPQQLVRRLMKRSGGKGVLGELARIIAAEKGAKLSSRRNSLAS